MIPESPEKREELNKFIDRAVVLLCEKDTLDEDLKILKDEVEENLGKDVAKAFKERYTARHQLNKKQEALEKLDTLLAEDGILKGG